MPWVAGDLPIYPPEKLTYPLKLMVGRWWNSHFEVSPFQGEIFVSFFGDLSSVMERYQIYRWWVHLLLLSRLKQNGHFLLKKSFPKSDLVSPATWNLKRNPVWSSILWKVSTLKHRSNLTWRVSIWNFPMFFLCPPWYIYTMFCFLSQRFTC